MVADNRINELNVPVILAKHQTFSTLTEAYMWANSMVGKGIGVQASRIWEDRIRKPRGKDSRIVKLLGVQRKAAKLCEKLAPGGQWNVEVEMPNTQYTAAGVLGPMVKQTKFHRLMAWYDRFLPYAYGMMKAEWDFKCLGVDFESINSYYGTCLGFVGIGQGDGAESDIDPYWRIVKEDVELFSDLYVACSDVKPPSLPFDEAFQPCNVFVALKRPDLFTDQWPRDGWMVGHVRAVCEKLNLPQPNLCWS